MTSGSLFRLVVNKYNGKVITAQGGTVQGLQSVLCVLIPDNRRTLLKAQVDEGTDTLVYRLVMGKLQEKVLHSMCQKGQLQKL